MPTSDEIRAAFDTAMASSQKDTHSSSTPRRDPRRPSTSSNLGGGIGPARTIRSRPSVSVNADLETVRPAFGVDVFVFDNSWQPTQKYETVMKGFKVLGATCEDLKRKLADSEEKVRSGERAYAALEEKARSDEASHVELASELTDQLRSYEIAHTELVSQMQKKYHADMAAFTDHVSKMEERIRFNEASYMALVSQMEGKIQAGEVAYSELTKEMEECKSALKDRESVTFFILTQDLFGLNDV